MTQSYTHRERIPSMKLRDCSKRKLVLEQLERRALMAVFGTPWPEPRSLSVSFPTDQAAIGAYQNTLRETLDAVADRRVWQEATLRAFQTWSLVSNINVGLVPDRGDDFGAVGLLSNDPRFGEFRVGVFPQQNALANAFPYQSIAGTWSGDVLINSEVNYFLADFNAVGPVSVPEPNENGPPVELFSVLLHEAGNALGLADNQIAGSVMNGNYSGPIRHLNQIDIASIRQLYGPRSDIYEPVNNNVRARATPIATPVGFSGLAPIALYGSMNTTNDVDFYRFTPLPGQEKVSIRLMASGISLLKAKLEIQDLYGNKVADIKADSIFENNLQVDIGSLKDHGALFIRVASNTTDVFGVGDYRIELDYRDPSLQPSIIPPTHDADADDNDDSRVDFVSVDALFGQVGIVDREVWGNDTLATATRLETTSGFLSRTRYEFQSSLATSTDRDFWLFQAPSATSPTLQVSVDPVGLQNPELDVLLLNANGDRVSSSLTRKPGGGVNVIVNNPVPSENYVLFVRRTGGSSVQTGNYVATINFSTNQATSLRTLHSGNLDFQEVNWSAVRTFKTQLFRFDLIAQSASLDNAVQMTIYDERTGDIVASFAAASGATKTEFVWLGAGSYVLRASARNRLSINAGPVQFVLKADTVSDDQGPRRIDPLQPPPQDWETPPVSWIPPTVGTIEPPFLPPWITDFEYTIYLGYYYLFL